MLHGPPHSRLCPPLLLLHLLRFFLIPLLCLCLLHILFFFILIFLLIILLLTHMTPFFALRLFVFFFSSSSLVFSATYTSFFHPTSFFSSWFPIWIAIFYFTYKVVELLRKIGGIGGRGLLLLLVLGWLLVVVLFALNRGGSLGICFVCWMLLRHCTKTLVYSNHPRAAAASSYLAIIFGQIASGIPWFLRSTAEPMQHPHQCWRWCRLW